jgi:hypothetical protein
MSTAFVRIQSEVEQSAKDLIDGISTLMRRVAPPFSFHNNPIGMEALARRDAVLGRKEIFLIWAEGIKVPRLPADGSS